MSLLCKAATGGGRGGGRGAVALEKHAWQQHAVSMRVRTRAYLCMYMGSIFIYQVYWLSNRGLDWGHGGEWARMEVPCFISLAGCGGVNKLDCHGTSLFRAF